MPDGSASPLALAITRYIARFVSVLAASLPTMIEIEPAGPAPGALPALGSPAAALADELVTHVLGELPALVDGLSLGD